MEVVTAVLGGDRDVAEFCEFSNVVELRDLEFADEFGVTKNSSSIGLRLLALMRVANWAVQGTISKQLGHPITLITERLGFNRLVSRSRTLSGPAPLQPSQHPEREATHCNPKCREVLTTPRHRHAVGHVL